MSKTNVPAKDRRWNLVIPADCLNEKERIAMWCRLKGIEVGRFLVEAAVQKINRSVGRGGADAILDQLKGEG